MQQEYARLRRTFRINGTAQTDLSDRRLDLDVPELTEEIIQNISAKEAAGQLDYLTLRIRKATPTLKLLCNLSSLKELDLRRTRIKDEDIQQLRQNCTLMKIDLESCEELTNANPLSSIRTLEKIDLSSCISLTHVSALGKLPALKYVDLNGTGIKDTEVNSLISMRQKLDLPSIEIKRSFFDRMFGHLF